MFSVFKQSFDLAWFLIRPSLLKYHMPLKRISFEHIVSLNVFIRNYMDVLANFI